MGKDDVDFDALGLSDEALGIGSAEPAQGRRRAGGTGGEAGGGRRRPGGRGRLLLFLSGLALGVAGALVGPRLLGPYLPEALRGGAGELVEGEVLGKRLAGERLLLTVETPRGAVLASFGEKVAEIDLLVEEGDSVSLGLGRYRPFVDDPSVEGVRKAARPAADRGPREPGSPPTEAGDTTGAEPDAMTPEESDGSPDASDADRATDPERPELGDPEGYLRG